MRKAWSVLVTPVTTAILSLALAVAGRAWAADEFTIEARDFDRGNVRVSLPGQSYAKKYSCIWNAGELPNRAEYEIEFPVTADYALFALYTAQQARPVDISLDGKKVHTGISGITGDWNTDHARWEQQCTLHITQGLHTIQLERQGAMPHICAVRMKSSAPFPDGWRLRRPGLEERRRREAKAARLKAGLASLELLNAEAMRRAVADLAANFPERFPDTEGLFRRVAEMEGRKATIRAALEKGDESALPMVGKLQAEQRELFLANPLIDFDRLLVVKRGQGSSALGLPCNWQGNCALPKTGFDDEIALLSMKRPDDAPATLYKPKSRVFVGDVDLHFDADRLLFSSIGEQNCWQVFEIRTDGSGLRQATPGADADVDNYDACYLPDGRIIFSSTRIFAAVPCVNGSSRVANLFRMNPDGTNIRQLCFDQEHNWCPTVLSDGRVLYTRWEYTDTPHTHTRLLFHMNPDGTQQMEFSGSNSYWPNSMFYTRPIPGHPTKVATIVSGHHGVRRMGELVILDTAKGRHETDGVVQRIPGYGQKVEPLIEDNLVDNSWPKFLHPFPLGDASRPWTSGKYFLVACQPSPQSLWGIYLVDIFDNVVLLREEPGYALLEPIPLRKTPRPPVIPDQVDLNSDTCTVQITDIYQGPGLAGIPRGTVKGLRVFTYTYDYPGMGGPQGVVGMEGPWDIRRILGTVPVQADGSAMFLLPANTPVSLQPLDADGKALQVMRSWLTGMPGEKVSCVGCHEPQNAATPNKATLALRRGAQPITPWRGPARGYSFANEVQPVLDRYCIGCHNGKTRPDGTTLLDLRGAEFIKDYDSRYHHGRQDAGKFSVAYANLQRFVRRPGLESDYHVLAPMEFHASTVELYQMIEKGHHNVKLDAEAWDRLITWIDLNAPFHGSWITIAGEERVRTPARRRREMLRQYAGVDVDMEWTGPPPPQVTTVMPEPEVQTANAPMRAAGCPLEAQEARRRQSPAQRRTIPLAEGVELSLVLIPAGEFVMGCADGCPDEAPPACVHVNAFWMGQFEITNEQYALFDPGHDSRVEIRHAMQFGVQGWPLNGPKQPVVRVSWQRAMDFCRWLSKRTGQSFSLPTEAQWEYACRAGAAAWFSYGDQDADFSKFANLADVKLRDAVSHPYKKENVPLLNPSKYDDWIPRDQRFNDGELVSASVGKYLPNPWGLHDMHGNVCEWTLSAARPYPYVDGDGRNDINSAEKRIVRGGSWRDRPARARASFRLAYQPYQRVYNVGFRVVMNPSPKPTVTSVTQAGMDR
ncbi:MAG: SUMF1/EgtB/PvdO family nonheme iron enzyme [Planctomycetota bacterium]